MNSFVNFRLISFNMANRDAKGYNAITCRVIGSVVTIGVVLKDFQGLFICASSKTPTMIKKSEGGAY